MNGPAPPCRKPPPALKWNGTGGSDVTRFRVIAAAPSGKQIVIRASRRCVKCKSSTQHLSYGIRYEKAEPATDSYLKHMFWTCETSGELSEELKEVPEPTERVVLINRLLKVREDYDAESVSIQSDMNAVTLRIEFPDCDPARLRRLALKLDDRFMLDMQEHLGIPLLLFELRGSQPGRQHP